MGAKKGREYSLSEIFELMARRLWIIVIFTALFTFAAFLVSSYVIDKEYTASVSMYVEPNSDGTDRTPSLSELSYAQQVVQTYIELLKTNAFMREVAAASGLDYTPAELQDMIVMKALNETEIFQVQVTSNDRFDSLKLAYTISILAPQKIIEIKEADAVKVVDDPVLPTSPAGPNIRVNTAVGFILGVMLSIMLVLLLDMMDNKIKNEDDITRHYNVPILGSVPRFRKLGGM